MESLNSRLRSRRACNVIPSRDDIFADLLDRALEGDVPVYFAIIPRALARPFDATCSVLVHPAGQDAVNDVIHDWRANKFHYAWVYPRDGAYILSDDYVIWAAVEHGQVEYLPCWILGFPSIDGAAEISGPMDVSVVRLIRELPE